jgi:hypothetical protein
LTQENKETNDNSKFLQPYPVVTTDEIGTAVISAVLSSDKQFLRQTFPVTQDVETSRCVVDLFRISLSVVYALLNDSLTATNDLDAK